VVEVAVDNEHQEEMEVLVVVVQADQPVLEIQLVLTLEVAVVVELEMVVQVIRVEQVDQE
jgi:hypothetical protein